MIAEPSVAEYPRELPSGEIEYKPLARGKAIIVSGVQVGRFAVRARWDGEYTAGNDSSGRRPARQWIVDHLPTGAQVFDSNDRAAAQLAADELSRWSVEDPDSTDCGRAVQQIGADLFAWLDAHDGKRLTPYRQWRAQRAGGGA